MKCGGAATGGEMAEMNSNQGKAHEILEASRLRRTPGRMQLMRILLGAEHPLTQQEIHTRAELSKVSVYRALESFRAAGIVHRVDAGDRLWRFAVCDCLHNVHCHPHFTCRVCGEVECLDSISLPRIPISPPGYQVEEQEVYLRGACAKCSAKGSEK